MKTLRVCLAQINPTVGDLRGNADKISFFIRQAQNKKADVVVFPELSLPGYPPEDLLLKKHFILDNQRYICEIAKAARSILAIVGFPYFENGKLFNAAAFLYGGKVVDVYKKMFLPNYGVFDEQRYFAPGATSNTIGFGKEVRIGVNICEDIWHADGPQRTQALRGKAGVIINISASPYHVRKIDERERILSERAKENHTFVLYCNLVGGQDELIFDGGSLVFDPSGKILARGKQFAEDFMCVELNIKEARATHRVKKIVSLSIPELSLCYKSLPSLKERKSTSFISSKERKLGELEEVYSALTLGLKDYVQKNNFRKVVFGLSGGIDSALTAVLAVDALGSENVLALTMPSKYSSFATKNDAQRIASNLKIRLITMPIDTIYRQYLKELGQFFKSTTSGIAEQNIQARIRGNLLMAFSNKFGMLVLTTGNKSEISTGYCTLYGDMAGGFSVLKDVPKGLVYRLSEYRNNLKKEKVIPQTVLQRAPSAELKPNQKDQDTLPPYPVLDKIIDLYIEKDYGVEHIIKKGFSEALVKSVVAMIDKNEYKRRQASPGVKITPRAFGKDRRMPITNKFIV